MIYIHLLILLALALAGMYTAYKTRIPALYIIVSVALLLAAVGLWTGGIYPAPGDLCLNYTTEDSLYWDCNKTITTTIAGSCFGEPVIDSCSPYTEQQCRDIYNCTWGVQGGCTGTPNVTCVWLGLYDPTGYKCEETAGCGWTAGTTETEVVNATCDSVNVSYVYDYCEPLGEAEPEASGAVWSVIFVLLCLLLLGAGIIEFMGGHGGATTQASQSAE